MLSYTFVLALALLLLALEHFGVPIPGWLTGIFLVIAALMLLLGLG
jgi:hypothetical protein